MRQQYFSSNSKLNKLVISIAKFLIFLIFCFPCNSIYFKIHWFAYYCHFNLFIYFCLMHFRHLQRCNKVFIAWQCLQSHCIGEFQGEHLVTNASSYVSFVVFIASHWLWWIVLLIARWTENTTSIMDIT